MERGPLVYACMAPVLFGLLAELIESVSWMHHLIFWPLFFQTCLANLYLIHYIVDL